MKLFGKKGDDEDRAPAEGAEQPTRTGWALPPDAGVAAGGSPLGPSTPAGAVDRASTTGQPTTSPGLSGAAVTSPSAGAAAAPAAAAAAQSARNLDSRGGVAGPPPAAGPPPGSTGDPSGHGEPTPPAGMSSLAAAQQKPELVVAGAFVGAFLAARILRRIAE